MCPTGGPHLFLLLCDVCVIVCATVCVVTVSAGQLQAPSAEGGEIEIRNCAQFYAIFLQLRSACPLSVLVGALCLCEQLLQNNTLPCFPAPKKSELCFNFMVMLRAACCRNSDTRGQFDLFQHSEAPVQNCCSLRLQEGGVQFGLVTTPQFSCNFSAIFHNFPAISRNFPASFRNWIGPSLTAILPPPPCPLSLCPLVRPELL